MPTKEDMVMDTFSYWVQRYLHGGDPEAEGMVLSLLNQQMVDDNEHHILVTLMTDARSNRIKLYTLLLVLHNCIMDAEILDYLSIDRNAFRHLCRTPGRIGSFLIVNEAGDGRIAEVFLAEFPSREPRCVCLDAQHIKEGMILSELTGKSFVIGFSEDFGGDSWMLSGMAALSVTHQNRIRKLAFTGGINPIGRIRNGDSIEDKIRICRGAGKRLIYDLAETAELEYWLQAEQIPVPIIQMVGEIGKRDLWLGKMESLIKKRFPYFSIDRLEHFFGLDRDLLCFHQTQAMKFDPGEWQTYLTQTVKDRFDRIEGSLHPVKPLFWYAGMISSLQFGVGVLFGFKRPIAVCHLDFTLQQYHEVIRLYGETDARSLKNVSIKPEEFRYIEYQKMELDRGSEEVALIIYLGSHNPISDVQHYCTSRLGLRACLIVRAQRSQGQIGVDDDWLRIVQEINSLLNLMKQEYHWTRIHLFQTAPTAICLALGMAIGHFVPVRVYHYQVSKDEYYRAMFDLDVLSV